MDHVTQLKALLAKIEAISVKYVGVAEKEQYDFNVFSILRKAHEEVGLHSAFLKALFDPHGGHGQGVWFLNRFLEKAKLHPFEGQKKIQVFSEYTRLREGTQGESRERDSIDIYIKSAKRAIVIENKIYAGDQEKQIERYVKFACDEGYDRENIDVIYLTLDNHEPSAKSLGNYDSNKVIKMSYDIDIILWLDACIEHMGKLPTTRESLILYQRVVKGLTGKAMNEEEMMEIAKYLIESPNIFQSGLKTLQAMDVAKGLIEIKFWQELKESLMSNDIGFCENVKNEIDAQFEKKKKDQQSPEAFYKRKRPWTGIEVLLGNLNHQPDTKIYFYVAVQWNIYYGVTVGKYPNAGKMPDALKVFGNETWSYPGKEEKIDFKKFNEKAVKLIDDESRKLFIAKFSEEIKEAIQQAMSTLQERGVLFKARPVWIGS